MPQCPPVPRPMTGCRAKSKFQVDFPLKTLFSEKIKKLWRNALSGKVTYYMCPDTTFTPLALKGGPSGFGISS